MSETKLTTYKLALINFLILEENLVSLLLGKDLPADGPAGDTRDVY